MRLNRRGIFGLFAGAAAAPAVPDLPQGGSSIWTLTPKFNEIVAGTLNDRSSSGGGYSPRDNWVLVEDAP